MKMEENMGQKMRQDKRPAFGQELFSRVIEGGGLYVDKTGFLRPLLAGSDSDILIITRPHGFGKTMALSMIMEFLQPAMQQGGCIGRRERLFQDLAVMGDRELCDECMGRFPVIFLGLKDAWGPDFDTAMAMLAASVSSLAMDFSFLLCSSKLLGAQKQILRTLMDRRKLEGEAAHAALAASVLDLASMLQRHFGHEAAVLIDDCDVPLAKAREHGYCEAMIEFLGRFFGFMRISKGSSPIGKIIMTSSLDVSGSGIFAGADGFPADTVLSAAPALAPLMGFTREEAEGYLGHFGLSSFMDLVTENYGGLRLGKEEIFRPCEVAGFASSARRSARDGWPVEAGDFLAARDGALERLARRCADCLCSCDNRRLQDLMDGKEVEVQADAQAGVALGLGDGCGPVPGPWQCWALLLHAGLLAVARKAGKRTYAARIPNLKARECLARAIRKSFDGAARQNGRNLALADALLGGDDDAATDIISDLLGRFICIGGKALAGAGAAADHAHAPASDPDEFYSAFLSAVLGSCGRAIEDLRCSTAAGHGHAFLRFCRKGMREGAVAAFSEAPSDDWMEQCADKALWRDECRMNARDYLKMPFMESVRAAAIAFSGRRCLVRSRLF